MKQISNNNMDWPSSLDAYCKRRKVASTDIIKIIKMTLTDLAKDTALRVTVPHYIVSCGGGLDDGITAVDVTIINDKDKKATRAVIDVSDTVVNNDFSPYAINGVSLQRVYDGDGIMISASIGCTTRDIIAGGGSNACYTPSELIATLRRRLDSQGG